MRDRGATASAAVAATEKEEPIAPSGAGRRRARVGRGGAWAAALAAMVVLAGLVIWLALDRSSSADDAAAEPLRTSLAEVVRTDLVDTESFPASLAYGGGRSVVGFWTGTLTALAAEGDTVERGGVLFKVDDRPVVLLYGAVPAYRQLERGVSAGRDVRQLERNLVELGYDPDGEIEVDRKFTSATRRAVRRWQDDLGLADSGVVALGDVLFSPGPVRVGQHRLELGAPLSSGVAVMEVASADQVVTLDLPADRQTLLAVDDAVVVELPDGARIDGTVSAIGTVAGAVALPDGSLGEPTIPVEIRLAQAAPTNLDQAPVTVEVAKEARRDALAVPVTALLALQGGGYAVEVAEGETTRLVAVEPGLYADGLVEVSGDLREGAQVVVPE